jgi:predicted nucleic acid-binding protein
MILFLDACAIIYWVELVDPYYQQFSDKLTKIKSRHGTLSFAASELSLLECQVKPLREKNEILLNRYNIMFEASDLKLISLTTDVIQLATQLRAKYYLATPDALQAASALSISDDILFISADKSFKKIPGLLVEVI